MGGIVGRLPGAGMFALLLCAPFLAGTPGFTLDNSLGPQAVFHFAAVTLAVAVCIAGMKKTGPAASWRSQVLILYLLFHVVSWFYSEVKFNSMLRTFQVLDAFAAYLVGDYLLRNGGLKEFRVGLAGMLFSLVALAIYSAYQVGAEGAVLDAYTTGRAYAMFGHPNVLAGFVIFAIWVAPYFYINGSSSGKLLSVTAILSAISVLFLTGSRGAMLSLAVSIALCLGSLVLTRMQRKTLIRIAASALAALALIAIFHARFESFFARGSREMAESPVRPVLWKGAFAIFAEHPVIGTGVGTFENAFTRTQQGVIFSNFAHNMYLQALSDSGLIGLLLLLGLLSIPLVYVVRVIREKRMEVEILLLAGAVIALIVHGFIEFAWESPAFKFSFFYLLAFFAWRAENTGTVRGGFVRIAGFSTVLVLSFVSILFYVSAFYSWSAGFDLKAGFETKALSNARTATLLLPDFMAGKAISYEAVAGYKLAAREGDKNMLRDAIGNAERLVEAEPRVAAHRYLLAKALYSNGDSRRALDEMKKTVSLHPGFLEYRDFYAKIMFLSDKRGGIELMKVSARIARDYFDYGRMDIEAALNAFFTLADSYFAMKDVTSAVSALGDIRAIVADTHMDVFTRLAVGDRSKPTKVEILTIIDRRNAILNSPVGK